MISVGVSLVDPSATRLERQQRLPRRGEGNDGPCLPQRTVARVVQWPLF